MSYLTLYTIGCWLVAAFMIGGVCAIWYLIEKVEKLQRENEELRRVVEIADDYAKIMQGNEVPYKASPTANPNPVIFFSTSDNIKTTQKLTCEN